MTDLRVRLLLEAEAEIARRAILQLNTDLQGVAITAAEATDRATAEALAFGAAYEQAGARASAAMQATAAGSATLMRSQSALAAESANVAAQVNDIAVMWAAGQAPLMTAIQQGTQLTQILGNQGVAGAAELARGAIATMFNPFSIGLIAALTLGGTFVQWLFDTSAAAKTVEDHLADVKTATDAMTRANETAGQTMDALTAKYGAQAAAIRDVARAQADAQFRAGAQSAAGASRAIVDSFRAQGVGVPMREIGDQQSMASLLGMSDWTGTGLLDEEVRRTVNSIGAALQDLDLAAALSDPEQRLEAMTASAETLRQRFQAAAEEVGGISDEENAVLQAILAQQAALARLRAERAQTLQVQAADLLAERATDRGDTPRDVRRRTDEADLRAETAELQRQAQMQALIARYGEDSYQVAIARRAAERENVVALLATSQAAASVKAEFLAAWDAANLLPQSDMGAAMLAGARGLAELLTGELGSAGDAADRIGSADMSSGIVAALGPAMELAARLWDAARAQAAVRAQAQENLEASAFEFSPGGQALTRFGSRAPGGTAEQNALAVRNRPITIGSGGGNPGGGRGGGAAAEAREAAAELRKAAEDAAREIERAREDLVDSLRQGFTAPFADFIAGTERGKAAFADFVQFMQQKAAELAANQIFDGLIAPLFEGVGSSGAAGGGFADFIGGLFGGPAPAGPAPLPAAPSVPRAPAPGRALASLAAELPGPRTAPRSAPAGEGGFGGGPRKFNFSITNTGEPVRGEAEVTENGDEISIDVMLDQIESGLARRVMNRKGALSGALQTVHGLGRVGRS